MKLVFLRKSKQTTKDNKLEHFRKQILDHLDSIEGGAAMKKAGLPVGTIRYWNGGKKYIKIAPGKWRPKYDNETRGAKQAVAAIRRKIEGAKTAQDMLQIVLENRDRFSDKNGNPLPFIQELSKYVREKSDIIDKKANTKKQVKTDTGQKSENGRIRKKFEEMAVPMEKYDFSKENYQKLFPNGKVKTPLGEVKLGEHQYQKLEAKGRKEYLGAVFQTLSDPVVVVESERNGKKVKLFSKSFKENEDTNIVVSVVVDINGEPVSISTHQRDMNNTLNIVKKGSILYEKNATPTVDTRTFNPSSPEGRQPTNKVSPKFGEKSSPEPDNPTVASDDLFKEIQKKYQSAKTIEGDDDELAVGKETITGRWKLVEADTPTASHDETTFQKTEGFPTNQDGSTINDRDYEKDSAAQEAVMEIASDYDTQALSFDSPVIVTKDGVVISGNNRTMSSKIAAKKGTDKKYIEGLKKKAKKFGFSVEQVEQFKNPRVVFETDSNEGYSTKQFAKFNESNKKAMNPIESAVKVSKMVKSSTVESIAVKVGEFETLGELYADKKAANDIFNTLQRDGIIGQFDRPRYVTEEGITGSGKEFLETVLIGSVINEQNIRGLNREGCKSIRQKLVRAITPLIENKGMNGYSIMKELNTAVNIVMQVALNKDKFNSVEEYSKQQNMFEDDDKISVELAKRLEGTQKEFADFMQFANGGLKFAANGEADIFLGEVESREVILSRILNTNVIKKAIDGALKFFNMLKEGKAKFEKKEIILGKSGMKAYRWIGEKIQSEVLKKGGFIEGEHPMGGNGQFSNKGGDSKENNNCSKRILDWLSPENLSEAKGKTREDIFSQFGNKYEPIANIDPEYLKYLGDDISDPVVYSGKGYFINHAVNHHPEVDPSEYIKIPDILSTPDDVKLDDRNPERTSLVFVKKFENYGRVIVSVDTNDMGKIVIHKTFFNSKKSPYPHLRSIRASSPDNAHLSISHAGNPTPGVERFSTLGDVSSLSPESGKKSSDPEELQKSLTFSGYPLEGRAKVQGMDISIENKKGSTRSGTDKDGHEWSVTMNFDYGYIRGTVGVDKDHLDCYLGDNPESEIVYIVNQNDPVTGKFDEQKVMLGFNSEAEAKEAYLKQYDRPGFFGDIIKMDIDTFKDLAFNKENKGKVLKKAFVEGEHPRNEGGRFTDKGSGNLNEKRIAEIEEKLNQTVEKDIAKTDKGYVSRDKQGNIIYTQDIKEAVPLSNSLKKKLPQDISIEKKEFPADIEPWEKEKLEKELRALKAGYNSAQEADAGEYAKKKSEYENSVLNDIIGKDYYYNIGKDFTVDIGKLMSAIADEAVKQGAELYHVSEESGEPTSYYLKKDGKKVRLSNHEIPQIMHRTTDEYQETWDKNLTLQNNRSILGYVRLNTRDEFSSLVNNLFSEE